MQRASTNRSVSVTYGSSTTTGLKGGIDKDALIEIEGYRELYSFSVWVNAGSISDPKTGKTIKIANDDLRILGTAPDSIGAMIRIDVGSKYAGN